MLAYFRPLLPGLLLLIAPTASSELPSQAAMLANTCAGCHGPDGNSLGSAMPNISGLSDQFIMDAMEAFKEGERHSTVMARIARGYTEQQIEIIAKFYSQLPRQWPKQSIDTRLVKKGEKLHIKYCAKCHEDNGRSSEQDAGILANQKIPYLKYIMDDVLSGKYEISAKMVDKLRAMHSASGEQGLQQIIQFYGSQN